MKGSVQHDTVQLLDKYSISEILNAIMDVAADDLVHEMRMWFDKEFGEGERLEGALDKDIIDYITHELSHHNIRLTRLEHPSVSKVPTEDVKPPEEDVKITKDMINKTVKKLNDLERTIPRSGKEK